MLSIDLEVQARGKCACVTEKAHVQVKNRKLRPENVKVNLKNNSVM